MIAERILMGLLLGGVAIGCVLVLYPFLSALLWAGILVYTTWPVYDWLREHLRLPRVGASLLMVLLTAIVLVLPIAVAAPSSADDVSHLRHVMIGTTLGDLWNRWAADISVMLEALRPYFGIVVEDGLGLLLGIANGVLMFLLSLFAAFFFYVYGEPIADRLRLLLHRIAGVQADRLITVTGATVRGVVYGILGTAVVQGILTAFGLWLSGVPRPVLLGGIAGVLSVLPIGAPVVWIPAALWLMGSGHLGWGIFLAIYGGGAITGADSLIRPWFISRGAQLPFGLLGIFLGPVLLGIGYTLVNEWARGADPREAAIDH